MPGAVERVSKMEKKKKKSRRNGVAAISHQSGKVAAGVFTVEEAFSRHQHSMSSGKKSSNVEENVRHALASAAQIVHAESSTSFMVRNETATLSSQKVRRLGLQKPSGASRVITEDGSGSDHSEGFESLQPELILRGVRGNGLAHSGAAQGKAKRKREEGAVNDGDSESQVLVKTPKLSEEARVWQYVCNRSVFISRPQCSNSSHEKDNGANNGPSQLGQTNVFKEKSTVVDVAVDGKKIKVTLTKEGAVAGDWIAHQTGKSFGLDLEWQPNRRKGQPDNKVALMQISSETECLLVQMLFLDSIPSALVQFLKDPERKLVGVGIHGDTKKLRRDFGLESGGEVELTTLAVAHFKNQGLKRAGLKALAMHVLGFDMNKSKTVTMSNWSKSHLDRKQVEYACIDAWISHAIFCRLQESPVLAA